MSKTKKTIIEHEIVIKKALIYPIILGVLFLICIPFAALLEAEKIILHLSPSPSIQIILQLLALTIPSSFYFFNKLYEPTEYEEVVHVIKK